VSLVDYGGSFDEIDCETFAKKELRRLFVKLTPAYIGTNHTSVGDKIVSKHDGTPVGDLDNQTLRELRALISKHFPEDFTIGEEDQKSEEEMRRILARKNQRQWTIDGLDGTGNRRMGTLSFGAMVSLRLRDEILFAAIFRPADEECRGGGFFFAERGKGAWIWCDEHNEYERLRTAREGKLERIVVMLEGSSKKFPRLQIAHLIGKVTTRSSFSTCVAATSVAMGRASAFVSVENQPWDNWPAWLIIEEAGGIVTDQLGRRATPENCGNMLAAGNATDHATLLNLLTDREAILKFHEELLAKFLAEK